MENRNTCVNSDQVIGSTTDVSELACSFTRVMKCGQLALQACINIYVPAAPVDRLPTLLRHAEELNVRLPFVQVSVRSADCGGYLFVLQGLSWGEVTPPNVSDFLTQLTQDINTFLAYTRAHKLKLALGDAATI